MPDAAHCDLLIYSATPAGVIAAVTAQRRGAAVILLEQSRHVGGLNTSGLNTSEIEHMLPVSFGGLQQEFYRGLGQRYNLDGPLHRWESHVAEDVFLQLLHDAGVDVRYNARLQAVTVHNQRITSLTTADGQPFHAARFIDCSYEGDLAAAAGVDMTFGREAKSTYNESLAGQTFIESDRQVTQTPGWNTVDNIIAARTVDDQGQPLPFFTPKDEIELGAGDRKVMNYNFRVTVSTRPDRIPFTQPQGYNPEQFANLADWLRTVEPRGLNTVMGVMPNPSGIYRFDDKGRTIREPADKWELNNNQAAVWSLGHFGAQFDWPDGDHDTRQAVWREHKRHNLGLLYFLANEPAVPDAIRQDAARYGLAADEYTDNQHWPYQLYVREARRMVGDFIMTQHDLLTHRRKNDVIMLGSHWIDSHHVQRVALSPTTFRNEGRMWRQITQPYDIPYRCLLPKRTQVENLLSPVCVSASRVAFCSIRLESVWMLLAQAAAEAAAISLDADQAVHDVDITQLQKRLRDSGVLLDQP